MPAAPRDDAALSAARTYAALLERLRGYERVEPFPQSRRPDKLAGVRWLLERLEHPEAALRVVHVAGTNGKGMTCAMIAALLQGAGHQVGLYTSPHVVDLRERIMLNGALLDPNAFAFAGHRVLDIADAGRTSVHFSYFDVLTAMGLFAFKQAGCAWAVLETGLGGLSDATNAVDKELAVLTRIGFDHMYVLGNTLREIAEQKLGIVRAGVPTVLGAQEPELEDWMAGRIVARGSAVLRAADFRVELSLPPGEEVRAIWPDGEACAATVPGASLTRVKAVCAATALCAGEALLGPARGAERGNGARAARVRTVLATELPGRLERRLRQRIRGTQATIARLVLDGGHNAGALAALADELARWGIDGYTLIIGLQADKLVDEVRAPLGRLLRGARRILILAPQTARAPTTEALTEFLRSAQPASGAAPAEAQPASGAAPAEAQPARRAAPIEVQPDPRTALLAAARTPDQTLVATGSFWMLGDLMRLMEPA